MPNAQHTVEADRALSVTNACPPDRASLARARATLAQALARAELRGRERAGRDKDSSG